MQVIDREISDLIEHIGEHYCSNINNMYLRPAFRRLSIPQKMWNMIENITEKTTHIRTHGLDLYELYEHIIALAHFIRGVRSDLSPNLRHTLLHMEEHTKQFTTGSQNDKIVRDMTISNFQSNMNIFCDLVADLLAKTKAYDRKTNGTTPVYEKIPELSTLGELLVGL